MIELPVPTVELLKSSAGLLDTVIGTLNRQSAQCPCCGSTRFDNWSEQQMAVELEAVVRKLKRFAEGKV